MATVTTAERVSSYASIEEIATGDRVTSYASSKSVETAERLTAYSDKSILTPERVTVYGSFVDIETGERILAYQADPYPSALSEGEGEFEWTISGKGERLNPSIRPVPVVSIYSSSGDMTELCPHTIVLTQAANQSSTMSISIRDNLYSWHPYGNGIHGGKIADGVTVDVGVTWGGHSKTFSAIMKRPAIGREGSDDTPQITWAGVGYSSKLFKSKVDLATLGAIGQATGETNHSVLQEVCGLVGITGEWSGVKNIELAGPYHRQQLKPGEVAKQVLDLTLDNWRDEGKTVTGYNPEIPQNTWEYTIGDDIVFGWQLAPEDNDVYDKVVALRAIATGKLFSTGESTTETQVDDFGEYTVALPGISHPTTKVDYADYRGRFSDFRYTCDAGVVVRSARGNWPPGYASSSPIINATSVTFTWGAANAGVTGDEVVGGKGGISFYGTPFRNGTTGTASPTDMVTRATAGTGTKVLELAPTPLLNGLAALQYLASKALRIFGKVWVRHEFRLPLNHMIKCGDRLLITKDAKLGGGTFAEGFEVLAVTHSISRSIANRYTQVTTRERRTS